jgi:hypothetical protein
MHLLIGTAWWATRVLGVCSATWIIGGITTDRTIEWGSIANVWLLGWPMLFAGFGIYAWIDARDAALAERGAD